MIFFRNESKGYEAVVNRWLFERDELANDMLERFMVCECVPPCEQHSLKLAVHPLIHMGCGLEFHQPALIVEALAETAASVPRMGNFLSFTEKKPFPQENQTPKSWCTSFKESVLMRQSPQW
jgi:hypothetical protein